MPIFVFFCDCAIGLGAWNLFIKAFLGGIVAKFLLIVAKVWCKIAQNCANISLVSPKNRQKGLKNAMIAHKNLR